MAWQSLWGLEAATHVPHALHADTRMWPQTSCYVDVWIELLSARGLDPHPLLAFTVATDFEGDQWTFLRPPHGDLEALFGIEVQELNLWRPIAEHAQEQIARGRVLLVDMNNHWLPDTRGISYRTTHGKSAIAMEAIDIENQRLRYFHNASLHELSGEDYRAVLREGPQDPAMLSPYCELLKWPVARAATKAASRQLLVKHAARRPLENPLTAMGKRFIAVEQAWLLQHGLEGLHTWSFGTLRMCGAAFELAETYLRWLGEPNLEAPAAAFSELSLGCKTLQFKLARAVNAKREFAAEPAFAALAEAWERGQDALAAALA